MTERKTWIVGPFLGAVSSVAAACEAELSPSVVRLSYEELVSGDFEEAGRPAQLVLDLSDDANWPRLEELHAHYSTPDGPRTPFIGVVDRGLPVERAIQGARLLTLTWRGTTRREEIAADLARADDLEREKRQTRAAGCRSIEVNGTRYVTYTPALFPVFEQIHMAASRDFNILLVGETGTGKTTFAQIIHQLSPRAGAAFVNVPCGAMPTELMGSELFGHLRGAFTGADRDKRGKFTVADGGTLLLDEIDVLALEQQANLLRVIETGEFEPLGSNETQRVDVRVIAASNQSLEEAIAEGDFRSDLFYRLKQVCLNIPPLRQRRADIVALAVAAMRECAEEQKIQLTHIAPEFLELITLCEWPGNIRELKNEVRRAVLFSHEGLVTAELLSADVYEEAQSRRATRDRESCPCVLAGEVAQTEREAIEVMLRLHDFNRTAAARALGISRVTLYNKIRKYRINLEDPEAGRRRPK